MRIKSLSLIDLRKNFRRNIKLVVLIVAICTCIGVIIGIIDARNYAGIQKSQNTEKVELVTLEELNYDEKFFYTAFFALKKKHDSLWAYLQYFEQVDLTPASKQKLDGVQSTLLEYEPQYESALDFYHQHALAFPDKKEETIRFYTEQIKKLKKQKKSLNVHKKELQSGDYTDAYRDSRMEELFFEIEKIENNLQDLENIISFIEESNIAELQANIKKAQKLLNNSVSEINDIVIHFNNTMEAISKTESYEIVYNKYLLEGYLNEAGMNNELEEEDILENRLNQAIIYAKSVEGLDVKMERAMAILTFFMLFGIVLAVIIGVCYTKKINSDNR